MNDFFAGRKTGLLTDENEIRGLKIWQGELEEKEMGHMACRLEEGVTFLYVMKGSLACQVNQEEVEMEEGEGLFVNSKNAYRFTKCGRDGVTFYLAVMEESYVGAEKYTVPVWTEEALSWMKPEREEVSEGIHALGDAAKRAEAGCELELRSLALKLWLELYREFLTEKPVAKKAEIREKVKLYGMLSYIHENYKKKITLGELAENSGVSTGEYCRFFKKRMNQTPFEYLQTYRIERCLPEILEKSDSITNIALRHGFTGSSYFAETFRKEMGCAPGDYRKWYKGILDECPLKAVEDKTASVKKEEKKEEAPARRETRRESMPTFML